MSERDRNHSRSARSSRDNSSRRDHRGTRDRQGSRSREQSLDENSVLRLEMKAMMSRLKVLEAKARASPLPGPSGRVSACSRDRVEVRRSDRAPVRSGDIDKNLEHDSAVGRPSSRRLRTPSLSRDRLQSADRRALHSVRSPSRRRSVSHVPRRTASQQASMTRGHNHRRSSRSRSKTPPLAAPERSSEPVVRDANVPSESATTTFTDRIVDAIRSINAGRSSQHYYISNFDPTLHNIDDWCLEVDRAKDLNNWSDFECLSRIGNCLKGDARSWLNEWVTNDRSWSNFKREFKPLCPKVPDVAGILFEVMCKNSDSYPTYADYVRRSLLRLRIVRGLSDELMSAIIIRGVTDPSVRASATNAKLLPNDLVEFFSTYVKPSTSGTSKGASSRIEPRNVAKDKPSTDFSRKRSFNDGRCYSCGQLGHRQASCAKKPRIEQPSSGPSNNGVANSPMSAFVPTRLNPCTFCKKPGHKAETCFAKQRSEAANKDSVNFCSELGPTGTL